VRADVDVKDNEGRTFFELIHDPEQEAKIRKLVEEIVTPDTKEPECD
jgi:hypothetical protein